MSVTAYKPPATRSGNLTNPARVTVSDDSFASYANSGSAGSLSAQFQGYSFTIPSNATVTGVQYYYEAYVTPGIDWKQRNARLITNTVGASYRDANMSITSTKTGYTFGGSTDLLGFSASQMTPSFVNQTSFGVEIAWQQTGTTAMTFYLDYVAMRVYYTVPASGANRGNRATATIAIGNRDEAIWNLGERAFTL